MILLTATQCHHYQEDASHLFNCPSLSAFARTKGKKAGCSADTRRGLCVKYEVLAHVTCTSRNLLNVVGTLIRKFLINITKTICVQIFKNLAKLMVY